MRGITVAGASAASGALLLSGARPAAALPMAVRGNDRSRDPLVLDYRPSQPTGWGQGFTPSIGGHTPARDFSFRGTAYRISLILANPVYEDVPSDPGIQFRQTLADSFDKYYSFRYLGGLPGRSEFIVESNNVWVSQQGPGVIYGADLFVVYNAGGAAPDACRNLQWIQVINWPQGPPPGRTVDNDLRASPFYIAGGLTSINGNQRVTFADIPQQGVEGAAGTLADWFMAEVFLVQDTGIKDASGKAIVNIFGGIRYGWQVARR